MADRLSSKRAGKKEARSTVLYLYGISKGTARTTLRAAGVDGVSPVEGIACFGLTCWVSRVQKTEFADRLITNMQNLDWLAGTSVRHQRAVSAIAKLHAVLPTRFGTVFLNEQSLKRHIEQHKESFEKNLKRISGADEWGIKIFRIPKKLEVPVPAISGKDYLKAKAALLETRTVKALDPDINRFQAAVAKIARQIAEGGAVTAGQPDLEWHGSALVSRDEKSRLTRLLERYSQKWEGVHRIECTGPWPPYSFVSFTPSSANDAGPGVS